MKAPATLALALSLMLAALGAYANEIGGIKLGMSLSQAKNASTVLPNMKAIPIYTDKVESGVAAFKGKMEYGYSSHGPSDEIIAFKGHADGIWYIQRAQRLPVSERYTEEVLMDSLLKRFGKDSGVAERNREKIWFYSKDGKQYIQPAGRNIAPDSMPCPLSIKTGDNFGLPDPLSVGSRVMSEFKQDCKAIYYVSWQLDANKLVSELETIVIDSAAMLKFLNNKNSIEEAQRKQQTQQQINKGVKPSL